MVKQYIVEQANRHDLFFTASHPPLLPMSDNAEQNFANHTKWVPLFHYIGAPLAIGLFVWNIKQVINAPSVATTVGLLTALMLVILLAMVRQFPLKVQDRLIRLEEQLRLARLLPADLQSRIGEFSVDQLVAMRFASDAELPELARRVLNEKLTSRKAVKSAIKQWRPDRFRV